MIQRSILDPCFVMLPGHRGLLGSCVKIIQDRKDIAHDKKTHVSRDEAWYALSRTEKLVKLLRYESTGKTELMQVKSDS